MQIEIDLKHKICVNVIIPSVGLGTYAWPSLVKIIYNLMAVSYLRLIILGQHPIKS